MSRILVVMGAGSIARSALKKWARTANANQHAVDNEIGSVLFVNHSGTHHQPIGNGDHLNDAAHP
jgi:hypothetical protein